MADHGQEIGKGHVKVTSDTTNVDASMAALPKKFVAVEVAAKRMGDQVRQSSASGAMGLMMLSQLVDDAQYGFRALVNQIPQAGMALASTLGMGTEAAMKFGGVAGIAAVAINLLLTHWDSLMNSMGMGRILTEAEQMEKLAKATKLTADEQERLNRFKKEEAVRNEMSQKMASGVEKTTADVKQVIADLGDEDTTGRSKLVSGLVLARRDQGFGTKMTDAEEKRLRNAETMAQVMGGDAEARKFRQERVEKIRASIQARLDREDVRQAEKTVDTAPIDSDRRKQLINEIRKNPGAFPVGAADKLEGVKPAQNVTDKAAADLAKQQAEGLDDANKADFERYQRERDTEDSRLANAMTGSVGQRYLANPQVSDKDLERDVKKSMEQAGIGAEEIGRAVSGTAKKLRENLDKAVQVRALDQGISEGQARQQLLQEARDRDESRMGRNQTRAEVMSTESYLNKLLVAGAGGKDDIPRDQLNEQRNTNKKLDAVIKELGKAKTNQGAATFARGRVS